MIETKHVRPCSPVLRDEIERPKSQRVYIRARLISETMRPHSSTVNQCDGDLRQLTSRLTQEELIVRTLGASRNSYPGRKHTSKSTPSNPPSAGDKQDCKLRPRFKTSPPALQPRLGRFCEIEWRSAAFRRGNHGCRCVQLRTPNQKPGSGGEHRDPGWLSRACREGISGGPACARFRPASGSLTLPCVAADWLDSATSRQGTAILLNFLFTSSALRARSSGPS